MRLIPDYQAGPSEQDRARQIAHAIVHFANGTSETINGAG